MGRRARAGLIVALGIFAAANVLLVNLVLPQRIWPAVWPVDPLGETRRFLAGSQRGDAWAPMILALRDAELMADRPSDTTRQRAGQATLPYSPPSLLVLSGIERSLGPSRGDLLSALNLVSRASVVLLVSCVAGAWALGAGRQVGAPDDRVVGIALVAVLALTFYPAISAYGEGQPQAWLNALFGAAVLGWLVGYRGLAGALMGSMALLKPQYAVLIALAALRGQGRCLVGAAGAVAVGLGMSTWAFGWQQHVDHLAALRRLAERGEVSYASPSAAGPVCAATVVGAVILIGAALWVPRRWPGPGGIADLCAIGLTAAVVLPVAGTHHYGILLPAYVVLVSALAVGEVGWGSWPWLGASYFLGSNAFVAPGRFPGMPTLAGALMALALLYRVGRRGESGFER